MMIKVFVLFTAILFLEIHISSCAPATKFSTNKYLIQYGYMALQDDGPPSEKVFRTAIENFQEYARLPVTGKLDEATKAMLTGPRCGASDRKLGPTRLKRFVKQGTKWEKMDLTYSLHGDRQPTREISSATVINNLEASFKQWQDVSKLSFTRVSDDDPNADIIVKFETGNHGDGYPFDGKGGTLAHGFYPGSNQGLSGDIHFDDDETWTINGKADTTDYTWTALHEIGHSIGLRHSRSPDAIMWPWFTGFRAGVKLNQDDINGIQSIYGKPVVQVTTTTKPPKPSICMVKSFDAVMHVIKTRDTYFFKGQTVWRMDRYRNVKNEELVNQKWPGLEGDLDAAYTRNDGDTIFFKGNRFWRYRGTTRIEGPAALSRYITNQWTLQLYRVGAATVWQPNKRTYFFTGSYYWRYNENERKIDNGYPYALSNVWRNVQMPVDDAIPWKNEKTVFFSNDKVSLYRREKTGNMFSSKVKKKHFIKACRD